MLATIEKNWYVVYTLSKHEKQVEKLLSRACIESFLPLYTEIRQWSDRKKKVVLPLFPNYLFVHTNPKDFWKILSVNGVTKFVSDGVKPGTISNNVIRSIQGIVNSNAKVADLELKKGERVRAISGPFVGAEGNLIRYDRKNILVINIELLHRSVLLEIDRHQVERV